MTWKPKEKKNKGKQSKLHLKAIEAVRKVFPLVHIMEEVIIPNGYIDIFLPTLDIAIEVQGRQHFKHVGHFHKTRIDFGKAQRNDSNKALWCEENGIKLIHFNYDEGIETWAEKLKDAL